MMRYSLSMAALLLALPLAAQTMPPAPGAPPAPPAVPVPPMPPSDTTDAAAAAAVSPLTDAEQKTLKRCRAMAPGQAAQSSKCSAVMTKAGQTDPAKTRAPVAQ